MADNQVIGATLQVDTGNSNANITSVNKNLKDVKTSLIDTGKAASSAGKDIQGATGSFSKIKEQISGLPGPLGEAGESVGKLDKTFKALLANPVVLIISAIVAVLALLYKSFTNTFEGGEKMEQVFAGIKAAGQALIDNLGKIADAIIKVFHFDFSGAAADIKAVGDAAAAAYSQMADLTKQAQELHREQLANDLDQAERAKRLAILREQASDDGISPAKRKAALQELKKDAEQNAADDIALAKKVTDNKIAQLTIERDGEKKNQDEINKLKIDQINVETDNANELRRIDKQLTSAGKAEKAERLENEKAANEAAKAERQKLVEFTNKLTKLQQDNELALLKDGYDKELKQLQNKIADEKRVNDLAVKDKKLTRDQEAKLNEALDIQYGLQKQTLDNKRNKEVQEKEVAFQKELATITSKTRLDAIGDSRKSELAQLEIGYQEKLAQAIDHYKDDSNKLAQIKAALDAQLKADQDKLAEKNKKEDDKKAFLIEEEKQKAIIEAKNVDFSGKLDAVKVEQDLVQKAFDDKVISELDYNTKIAALAESRKSIREQERQHNADTVNAIGDGLETLAEIAGKQTAVGKGLAIASTTIKTFQGAIAAFTGVVEQIPGPVGLALGAVAAAGAVASGIAAVKKIVAVQIPGQGGGGGAVPTGLPAQQAPVAPTQTSTSLDANSLNQIGNAASRVYVLDADVQNNREKDERLNRAARLGG